MTFRDFFRMTQLAVNGRRVAVWCFDQTTARIMLREYTAKLRGHDFKGWRAQSSNGNECVTFEGGGCVRFVSRHGHLDGADIIYDTEDELTAYLR